jgi:hypothetical protein
LNKIMPSPDDGNPDQPNALTADAAGHLCGTGFADNDDLALWKFE